MQKFLASTILVLISIVTYAQCGGNGWTISKNKINRFQDAKAQVQVKPIALESEWPMIKFNQAVRVHTVTYEANNMYRTLHSNVPETTIEVNRIADSLVFVDEEFYEMLHNGWFIKMKITMTINNETSQITICKCYN